MGRHRRCERLRKAWYKVTIGSPRSCANMYFWWPLTFNGTAMSTVILAVCPLLMRPPSAWSASS